MGRLCGRAISCKVALGGPLRRGGFGLFLVLRSALVRLGFAEGKRFRGKEVCWDVWGGVDPASLGSARGPGTGTPPPVLFAKSSKDGF